MGGVEGRGKKERRKKKKKRKGNLRVGGGGGRLAGVGASGGQGASWGWPASRQAAASRRGEENDSSLDVKCSPPLPVPSLQLVSFGQCLNPPGQLLRCIYQTFILRHLPTFLGQPGKCRSGPLLLII